MDYHKDDSWLFGPDNASNKWEGWSMVLWLIGLVIVATLLGCDGQAAEATHESVMAAMEKKEALMGNPCLYVAQCARVDMECDVKQRSCVKSADLTRKRK